MNNRSLFFIFFILLCANSLKAEIQVLSEDELKVRIGGASISVTSVSPNARIGKDNIYIAGRIDTLLAKSGTAIVHQNVGNGKTWNTTVSTSSTGQSNEESGTWVSSMKYPLNGSPKPIKFLVCSGNQNGSSNNQCTFVPNGGTIANIDISPSVRVLGVKFYNIKDGNQAASIPGDLAWDFADWRANGDTSTILPNGQLPIKAYNGDKVMQACNLNRRIQFRFLGITTLDATAWAPTSIDYTRPPVNANSIPTLHQNFINTAANLDAIEGKKYLRVFVVNDIPSGYVGLANSFSDNIMLVEDSFINASGFRKAVRLILHEIGHTQGLAHITDNCSGAASSNFMCSTIGYGGEAINASNPVLVGLTTSGSQCAVMYGGNGSGVTDLD
jgi:hypothetical protein|tara:strand:+ start:9048 stop:10205 length:1158 start_codon:yes stop_codon:yes gene_type:complete